MPAYRERVYLCPVESGQPGWIMDFPLWWDRAGFFEKYSHRKIDTGSPFHVDYGLLLTQWEAQAWDLQCRDAFSQDPRARQPNMIASMEKFDEMLKASSWVIVESYEWESGLE